MIGDIMSISRMRMGTDGKGVTTLVAFFDCPLHCKYCINDFCHEKNGFIDSIPRGAYTPKELIKILVKDDIYYKMSGGGIAFGGGEPLLQSSFIHEVIKLADPNWKMRIETSLNVPWRNVEPLLNDIDEWIIDVKDMDDTIYKKYTGCSNTNVIKNIFRLKNAVDSSKLHIRIPRIPDFNKEKNIKESVDWIKEVLNVEPEIFDYMKTLELPEYHWFVCLLSGQTIIHMSRRGKFLTFHFKSGDSMTLHLRMTGQLLCTPNDYPVEKHTHLVAELSNSMELIYIDVRRFGRFWYLKKDEPDLFTGQDKLGIDPDDEKLTAEYLKSRLSNRKKAIKEMLHDQTIIAGIGNIYSDEILFSAGIYPETKCSNLSDDDWQRLAEKIHEIIQWGIDTNAMTPEEYLAGKGKEYRNNEYLKIYGRVGQQCTKCNSIIEKITISGRSSCYCPLCQRKK